MHKTVAIVGGGQAGLSAAWHLAKLGIDYVVLERHAVGHAWSRERWDSFCLVTPNVQCRLPGRPYAGGDPEGFMRRDEIVDYIRDFARSFDADVRSGVDVRRVARDLGGSGYALETSAGTVTCDAVVIAAGNYHVPVVPASASRIDRAVAQLHSSAYRNPEALPPGDVLVVGSGQSGAQIAEDLHLAGRGVHLCVGSAPRCARRHRGRDVVAWLEEMGHYDMPVEEHPLGEGVRDQANHYVTGRGGGRDIDLRAFARDGMRLYGRLLDVEGDALRLGDDLERNLDRADAVYASINATIDAYIARAGIAAPEAEPYAPPWRPGATPRTLSLAEAGIGSIVWAIGFRPDFRFVEAGGFDARGRPRHQRGAGEAPGLFYVGLTWQHTWGSARFAGVARDAEYVAARIARRVAPARAAS